MPPRDYAAQPVADALGLRAVIDGLASDLQDMRAGRLSAPEALARAALAKQLFNGVRLFLVAHQMAQPKPPRQPKGQPDIITLPGPAE
jgi:hypothetical protein